MANYNDPDIQEFITEANELLDESEELLLSAENRPAIDIHASVFRVLHSIKGGASMLDLGEVQRHMHTIESQWNDIHQDENLNTEQCQYFLSALDATRKLFNGEIVNFNYNLKTEAPQNSNIIKTASESSSNKPHGEKDRTTGHVCLIDDDSDILEIISEQLEEQGIKTTCFTDPNQGIQFIKNKNVHCMLTDFKMPQMTGIDILKEVKKIQPDLPVLLISGHIDKKVLLDSLKIGGFWAVLEKPLKETDLIQHCLAAIKYQETQQALAQSIDLVLYHFSDLEAYLIENNQGQVAQNIRKNLKEVLDLRRRLQSRLMSS